MLTDTEIKKKGMKVLIENLGDLITKEPFDYTQWQTELWKDETVEQISEKAMQYRANQKK